MDLANTYNLATAAWLGVQAVPLLFTPKLIVALLSPDSHKITSLEEYFSRSLALSLLALALMCLFLSGAFPITSLPSEAINRPSSNPYAIPTVVLTTFYHTSTAVYAYTRYNHTGQATYVLAMIASTVLAATGLWVAMFANDSHISRRTGADKRTSGWPFDNKVADERRVPKKRF